MYAHIKDDKIHNIIIASAEFADKIPGKYVSLEGLDPKPRIGWSYDGTTFSPPTPPVSIPFDTTAVAVISISSNDNNSIIDGNTLTTSVGSRITIELETQASYDDHSIYPLNTSLLVSITGTNNTLYTLVEFVNGEGTISTTFDFSGKWVIAAVNMNAGIQDITAQLLMLDSIIIYTVQ